MRESSFQSTIIKWLRKKGCFVWKCKQDATTPSGVSDLFFCVEGFYGFIEVKSAKNAKRRPGQADFVEKMNNWSWAKVVYPEIWGDVQKELEEMLG